MAESFYEKASELLAHEVGVDTIDLSKSIGYECQLSQIFSTYRWDSEFYKPKYRRLLDSVLKAGKVRVEQFVPISRFISYLTNGHTPLHHDLTIGEVLFLTAEHVSDFRLDFGTDKRILRHHHETELARTALRNGDILITIKGKVGNCAVVRDCPKAANINQDVALIRLREGIHPTSFLLGLIRLWANSLSNSAAQEESILFLGLGICEACLSQ